MKRHLVLAAFAGLALSAAPAARAATELRFCLRAEPKTFDPLLVDDGDS